MIQTLLDLGSPVDQTDGRGLTPVGRAVLANRLDIAKLRFPTAPDCISHRGLRGVSAGCKITHCRPSGHLSITGDLAL